MTTGPGTNDPADAAEILSRAVQLHREGKLEQAALHYLTILAQRPGDFDAMHLLGVVRSQQERNVEARETIRSALQLNPASFEAWSNLGLVQCKLQSPKEALASFEKALSIEPNDAEALHNCGAVLRMLKLPEQALASYEQSLAVRPDNARTLYNRGNVLRELNRPEEALASFDNALAIRPQYTEALHNRGNALRDLKRLEEALLSYESALLIEPNHVDALNNRGNICQRLRRPKDALVSYQKVLAIKPDHPYALSGIADCALNACDWPLVEQTKPKLTADIKQRNSIVTPFVLLGYSQDASLQFKCADNYFRDRMPKVPEPLYKEGIFWHHDKIRVAYLSADFRSHAAAYLIADLFELHDRARFEIIGISFGNDDNSEIRSRLVRSFDQFHDVQLKSDFDVATLLREQEVDIAVDLMGYTQNCRPEILAHRPAPIQVSYFFAATMAAEFIDYILADKIVLPFDRQSYFTENIVHLPECYLVTSKNPVAPVSPTRQDCGLPDEGFVFCCFNNSWKITEPFFDVWMSLLRRVNGSVLWVIRDNANATNNLRREARKRGIDPDRLVFADRVSHSEHLARHRLADLFLDTLPFNAHTTAIDSLRAGVPIVTCIGNLFAGRVGASVLTASGLHQLIVSDLAEYEALALKLATDDPLLQSTRAKLARDSQSFALFDTDRFRRDVESAYLNMWQKWQQGEKPGPFAVQKEQLDSGFGQASLL